MWKNRQMISLSSLSETNVRWMYKIIKETSQFSLPLLCFIRFWYYKSGIKRRIIFGCSIHVYKCFQFIYFRYSTRKFPLLKVICKNCLRYFWKHSSEIIQTMDKTIQCCRKWHFRLQIWCSFFLLYFIETIVMLLEYHIRL